MKFIKKRGRYENSTGTLTYSPETKEAYSYNTRISWQEGGLLIRNWTTYSRTTTRHQYRLGDFVGDNEDVSLHRQGYSTVSLATALEKEIAAISWDIKELTDKMNTKGTRKKTNTERAQRVVALHNERMGHVRLLALLRHPKEERAVMATLTEQEAGNEIGV